MKRPYFTFGFIIFIFLLALNFSFADSSVSIHSYTSSNNNSSVNVEVNCVNGVCNTTKNVTGDPANTYANIVIATSTQKIQENVQKNINDVNAKIKDMNTANQKRLETIRQNLNAKINVPIDQTISGNVSGGLEAPTTVAPISSGAARNIFEQIKLQINNLFLSFMSNFHVI